MGDEEPPDFAGLPAEVVDLYKRSLLILRTQIDDGGAIIAANDWDIPQFGRDTYSYMWPRDGALVANALDRAGYPDVAAQLLHFCADMLTAKATSCTSTTPTAASQLLAPVGAPTASRSLPIQEDETALVVWALWQHFYRYRDIEFIRPL